MKQLRDAFDHRGFVSVPHSTRELNGHFASTPHDSLTALLRKAGPFKAKRDGYVFTNSGWPITEEDAQILRQRYQGLVDAVALIGIHTIREALAALSFSVPLVGTEGLPGAAIDLVLNQVTAPLRNQLTDSLVSGIPGHYGRCGGMAFSALDFFLVGWPISSFTIQPASGDLRQYIWNRLLDSLELNAATFLEWVMVLHILPTISQLASAALGAAVGTVIGGPLGAVVGGFLAGKDDVLGVGGAPALLGKTRDQWGQLRTALDREAAWPIGFIHGGTANPIDQHQVLATTYTDQGDGSPMLEIWDNNDGAASKDLTLHFQGDELVVDCTTDPSLNDIKGIIFEQYTFNMPPTSLHLPS